jgi:subtilase family serine protease
LCNPYYIFYILFDVSSLLFKGGLKMKIKLLLFTVMVSVIFSVIVPAAAQPKGNINTPPLPTKLPDLVALGMNIVVKDGGPLVAGKETMIGCNLKNNGGPFAAEFRIGIQMDGTPLGLPHGSTATPDTTSFATPWVAVAGMHTATCILDTQKVIAESNETNNVAYLRLNVPKAELPDLVALSMNVTVKDGSPLQAGKETMVGCSLKNNGGPFTEEFRIGIQMDGTPLGLPLGSTATPTTTGFATPWIATAGTHNARCILDTQRVIHESSKANNIVNYAFTVPASTKPADLSDSNIAVARLKPDITIEKIEVKAEDGTAVKPGKASRVYCHWKRTGSQPATTFRVLIKMDGTALTLPQGDTVDQTQTASWLGTPWTATAGNHQIYCEVDTQNAVNETNEKNNKWIQMYNLPGFLPHDTFHLMTDVMIEKIEVKAEDGGKIVDGKASRVYCYWKRTGAAPAADFRVAPFVDGTAIGLPQGSTVQHELTNGWLGTPWTARAGSHTIKCLADSAFEITEPNEANNSKTIGIDVPPAK